MLPFRKTKLPFQEGKTLRKQCHPQGLLQDKRVNRFTCMNKILNKDQKKPSLNHGDRHDLNIICRRPSGNFKSLACGERTICSTIKKSQNIMNMNVHTNNSLLTLRNHIEQHQLLTFIRFTNFKDIMEYAADETECNRTCRRFNLLCIDVIIILFQKFLAF